MTVGSDASAEQALAIIGHQLWCEQARAEGWTPGSVFDPVAKIHDQLVPFEQLDKADQDATRLAIETNEIARQAVLAVEVERAADRPLRPREMRQGLRVGWAYNIQPQTDSRGAPLVGMVDSWERDSATGELVLVRVRWCTGELTEHHPEERDLERLGPAGE